MTSHRVWSCLWRARNGQSKHYLHIIIYSDFAVLTFKLATVCVRSSAANVKNGSRDERTISGLLLTIALNKSFVQNFKTNHGSNLASMASTSVWRQPTDICTSWPKAVILWRNSKANLLKESKQIHYSSLYKYNDVYNNANNLVVSNLPMCYINCLILQHCLMHFGTWRDSPSFPSRESAQFPRGPVDGGR